MRGARAAALVLACWSGGASADALDRLMGSQWSAVRPEGGACEEPFWFELDPGRQRLTARTRQPIPSRDIFGDTFHYQVREVHEDTARMFLEHETWRDDAGALVEWWLVFLGPDSFAWRRSDWQSWMLTEPRFRCLMPG